MRLRPSLIFAFALAIIAAGCVAEARPGVGGDAAVPTTPSPPPAAVSGCGEPIIPAVDDSYADPATRRGPMVYPPILGSGITRVPDLDALSGTAFVPLQPAAPADASLQLVLVDADGVLRLYFGGPEITEGLTLPDFVAAAGIVVLEKPPAGQDAALVISTVGSRAGRIDVGPYPGALVHADPVGPGVRTWNLYWSDGQRDWSIIGGVDPETVVALGRSVYCGA